MRIRHQVQEREIGNRCHCARVPLIIKRAAGSRCQRNATALKQVFGRHLASMCRLYSTRGLQRYRSATVRLQRVVRSIAEQALRTCQKIQKYITTRHSNVLACFELDSTFLLGEGCSDCLTALPGEPAAVKMVLAARFFLWRRRFTKLSCAVLTFSVALDVSFIACFTCH